MEEQKLTLTHDDYVRMSIDAGVPPLELCFYPIVDCESGDALAFRTKTVIHSIVRGDMPEDSYLYVSDVRDIGAELLRHNLQHAIEALNKFDEAECPVAYLSVHCSAEIVENENIDLFTILSEILQKNPSLKPERLCLEFPATLMDRDTERAKTVLLDMKVLKVRTALIGCGAENFPAFKLLTVTPDVVILDPSVTAYASSRGKPQFLPSIVAYVKSMGIEAVAEGTAEDRRPSRRSECWGYLVQDQEPITLNEAIALTKEANAS